MKIKSSVTLLFYINRKLFKVNPHEITEVPETVKNTSTFNLHYSAGNITVIDNDYEKMPEAANIAIKVKKKKNNV